MSPATSPTPSLPGAALWRRFAAMAYDLLVLGGLSMGYGAAMTALVTALQQSTSTAATTQSYTPMFTNPAFFIGWIAVIVAFYCGFWCKSGQTIGMRAWRIRLVSGAANQLGLIQDPSLAQALLRCAAGFAGFLLFGLGYAYRWFNPQGDCWHDRVSGTRVILLPRP